MEIRYAGVDDAELLAQLGAKTFFDTFAKDNRPQDIARYIEENFSPAIQLREIGDADTIFLIAELEQRAVGYVKLKVNARQSATAAEMERQESTLCRSISAEASARH